ncbi:hypothetical protein ABIB99_006597 [Bradyrhizobium sp. LA6.1]
MKWSSAPLDRAGADCFRFRGEIDRRTLAATHDSLMRSPTAQGRADSSTLARDLAYVACGPSLPLTRCSFRSVQGQTGVLKPSARPTPLTQMYGPAAFRKRDCAWVARSLDPATESDLAVRAKDDDVEDFLPESMPIEASGCVVVSMGCFSGCCGVVFADYPRGGSSRSIPLAEPKQPTLVAPGGPPQNLSSRRDKLSLR